MDDIRGQICYIFVVVVNRTEQLKKLGKVNTT
jgi:hypothetical protein